MNKRKTGGVLFGTGAVLMLAALILSLYNVWHEIHTERRTQTVYRALYAAVQQAGRESDSIPADTDISAYTEKTSAETDMKITDVQGYDCIGILEIPSLSLSLPVLSEWTYEKLDTAPCRQFGSVKTGDLVIAGHNYRRHFLYLNTLSPGDEIRLLDMEGNVITYRAAEIRTVRPEHVKEVQKSGYPLVLYTCTYTGVARTAVFCTEVTRD